MKVRILALVVFPAIVTACSSGSGGGGATPPTAAPTSTPTVAPLVYALKMRWSSVMAPTGVPGASAGRTAAISGGSRILLASPGSTDVMSQLQAFSVPNVAVVQIVPSPLPSTIPSPGFTTDSTVAQIAPTPVPSPGVSPGVPTVDLQTTALNTTECSKSITGTIPAPISASSTMPICIYDTVAQATDTGSYHDHSAGIRWTGSAWVDEPDPTQADFYITDKFGPLGYNDGNSLPTWHIPGGGVFLSYGTSFDAYTTADWSSALTTFGYATLLTELSGGNGILSMKTRGGTICKMFITSSGQQPGHLASAFGCHGTSPDGT